MSIFETLDNIICDYLITPLIIVGGVLTLIFWGLLLLLIYPLSHLTFFLHGLEKKRARHEQEDYDAELDDKIERLQMKSVRESESQNEI